ncbi:MAG: hypothetical protein ABFR75_11005 [Acidobacteriota bacterium]
MTRRLIIIICLISLFIFFPLFNSAEDNSFDKGIVYLLLKDKQLAKDNFSIYFSNNPNPIVKSGFLMLSDGELNNAKKEFHKYLNRNFRSVAALVGISISVADIKESTTKENLKKAIRLNGRYSPAYACLGYEYLKENNYQEAEKNFLLALRSRNILEYRILLGHLYIQMNRPDKTIDMLEEEANGAPDNFHLNFLLANAFYKQNRIFNMGKYVELVNELQSGRKDVMLLSANYYLKSGAPKKARSILKNLRFSEVNEEYIKTYAKTLLKLGDRRAKNYLYQFFSLNSWDREINKLIGSFYLNNKNVKSNIQNWIYRAILSGNNYEELKNIFSENYKYPDINYLKFFKVRKVHWLDNKYLLAAAVLNPGASEKLYLIDSDKVKTERVFNYEGNVENIYVSKKLKRIIFVNKTRSIGGIKIFSLEKSGKSYLLRKLNYRPVNCDSMEVVFNSSESVAYFVDSDIEKLSFNSPFSRVTRFGEKYPAYSSFNFMVYSYNFFTKNFKKLDDLSIIKRIPSKAIKKYFSVLTAYQTTKNIAKLLKKGEKLDAFSSEIVKIRFSEDLGSFLIYLFDLKNAFQAIIFDNDTGETIKIDETMFLEEGRFAELEILKFDSKKNMIMFTTKDKRKDLIVFNYRSKLFIPLMENYYDCAFNEEFDYVYILTERDKKFFSIETLLNIVSLEPFWKEEVSLKRNLKKILKDNDLLKIEFSTNDGEILAMDFNNKFKYISPSYENAVFQYSPEKIKTAVFINKKLFVFKNKETWEQESPLKK